jgi:uncharacterized Zn finger protein (UPF0148 family)
MERTFMSLRCPACGREFDVTLFEFNNEVICPCGERLSLSKGHELRHRRSEEERGTEDSKGRDGESLERGPGKGESARKDARSIDWESLEKEIFGAVNARERELDRRRAQEIREIADRISSLILQKDMPRVDIEIEIKNFRAFVLDHFPEREELFRAIYVNRFRRLWDQFRSGEGPLFGSEGKVR